MRISKRGRGAALMVALAAILLASLQTSTSAEPRYRTEATYVVTYTNITEGQYLTPPNFAGHTNDVRVFQRGKPASPGVQAVAENGGVPVLAAELTAAIDDAGFGVSGVGPGGAGGPIAPGESVEFEFTTDASRFSLVSMVICTNDGFAGLNSRILPFRDGQTWNYRVRAWDAGTEINTELREDLVPAPFCGDGDGTGESDPELAENGVIKRHRTLRGVGDLDPGLDWRGPVAEVSIHRVAETPTYTIEIENLTDGQYLTPPNYAIHSKAARVFQRGKPASPGVQAVAENGGVPVLAAELTAAIDEAGLGVSGVGPGGAGGPIAPGESVEFDVTSDANRLSIVSMVVCTNDGFAGLNSLRVPQWAGDSRTVYVRAWDAGTEINTELREDLVPAPFCGDGDGTGESDPELAENGVIKRHRTLRGVGDLDPGLDWTGPVMKVTITKN